MSEQRDWNDPSYKKWRLAVKKRDRSKCKWPGCTSKKKLVAHHIRTWASAPSLRFVLSNGITLCKFHHDQIWGREEEVAAMLIGLIGKKGSKSARDRQIEILYELRKDDLSGNQG